MADCGVKYTGKPSGREGPGGCLCGPFPGAFGFQGPSLSLFRPRRYVFGALVLRSLCSVFHTSGKGRELIFSLPLDKNDPGTKEAYFRVA